MQKLRTESEPPAGEEKSGIMIGRVNEKEMMMQTHRRAVNNGTGSTLILEGGAGMGKSTLIHFLRLRFSEDGGLRKGSSQNVMSNSGMFLVGEADAFQNQIPFHAWRPIFSKLLRLENIANRNALVKFLSEVLLLAY